MEIPEIDTGKDELTTIAFAESRRNVFNFGIGIEIFINDRVSLYSGFSTDFNAITYSSKILEISGSTEGNMALNYD